MLISGLIRHVPAPLLRPLLNPSSYGAPFAELQRDTGAPIELLSGYRDTIKSAWKRFWWPTNSVLTLWSRAAPPELAPYALELLRARTLPRPIPELAAIAVDLEREFPEHLFHTGRRDAVLDLPVVLPRPVEAELAHRADGYRLLAADVAAGLSRHGLHVDGLRMLDLGCGTGYLAYAMAGFGAAYVVGVDRDPNMYGSDPGRSRMVELLAGPAADRVVLRDENAHALPFADGEFDVVFSSTAVEHFTDPGAILSEVRRVLRPGGLTHHGVEPWFSKRGGHSLCTLDFPWGHVRVDAEEFAAYVRSYRPHEANAAIDNFEHAYQVPRLTLQESRAAFAAAFRILEWRETPLPALDVHRRFLTQALLEDCRRVYPAVTRRDLATVAYTVIGRREGAS